MCALYQRAGSHKEKIRGLFSLLAQEETPMVRRVVARKLGDLALKVEKDYVISDLV